MIRDRFSGEGEESGTLVNLMLIVGVFISGLGGGVAFPILPTLGDVLGITPFVVGLILSVNRGTRVLLNAPAGEILDRLGTRRPMIFGFFVQALVPFGYVLGVNPQYVPVGSATMFLVARICWGVGTAFVFIGAFRTISLLTESDNRGKWIGYMRGGQSLGFPVGLASGGLMADLFGYTEAFLFAGVVNLFAAFVAVVVLPNATGNGDVDEARGLRALPAMFRADSRILAIAGVNFIVRFLYSGVLLSTIVLYLNASEINFFTFSELGTSGLIMATGAISVSVTTIFAGRYSDNVSNRAYMAVPMLAMLALGFGLLGLVPNAVSVVVAILLVGVGVGGSNPPLLAYLSDITPDNDLGKIGGVYNVFGDLGSTFGPLVAVPLTEIVGFRWGYVACGLAVVIAELLVVGSLLGSSLPVNRSDNTGAD